MQLSTVCCSGIRFFWGEGQCKKVMWKDSCSSVQFCSVLFCSSELHKNSRCDVLCIESITSPRTKNPFTEEHYSKMDILVRHLIVIHILLWSLKGKLSLVSSSFFNLT